MCVLSLQIVRQFIYEARGGSTRREINPDAAVSRQPKSVICDALYQLITILAAKRSDFVDHVLTLAHDLASEGVQGMNGFLLRHSLELVAAVSSAASAANSSSSSATAVDCYRDWVRDHFAAQDARARAQSLDTVTSSDAAHSTNAPAPPRCLKQHNTCSLVTSKRQIQFLCAFLLEFDRREQPAHHSNAGVIALYPVAKSSHVAAHLSVMKTHQPQFPSGGLIMDFCSQTRSRYLELLKIEQATSAAANSMESATGALQNGKQQRDIVSLHSVKARNMVREHIQLFRDSKKLSPQLRQWKMFQPQLWKQELIPCCLDIEFDNFSRAASSRREDGGGDGGDRCAAESKLLEHVAFVHALAKSSLVTVHEYSQFLVSAEEWLKNRQKRRNLKKKSYKRQRHGAAGGEGLDHVLELLQLEMTAERNDGVRRRRKRTSPKTMDKLRGALEANFESVLNAAKVDRGGPLQSAANPLTKQMQMLWDEGCVRVIRVLGLNQIEAFFTYLVPVFGQSAPSSQADLTGATPSTASQQDKGDGTTTHVSIAQFFVSRVSWTEQHVYESFLCELSSLAAVVAALLGACGESQSLCSMTDLAWLIERIDEKCVADDGSSAATGLLLPHDRLFRRFLFYSTMLRAADALAPDRRAPQVRVVTLLLRCESLKPEIRDFISWVGCRSMVVTGASQLTTFREKQVALQGDVSVQPLRLVLNNMRMLSKMKWCQEAFSLKSLEIDQLRRILTLEFRYGLKLFGEASALTLGASSLPPPVMASNVADPRQWLQIELDIIADFGGFRIASVESVSKWIVLEILLQVTAPITSSSDDDARELRSRDDAVALLLLILDDLMHKLNLEQALATSSNTNSFAAKDQGGGLRSHGRIVACFVASTLKVIRENGRVFPVNPRLQHHGFEILEICTRHQIDCRYSKDIAGGDESDRALLELIHEIGDHFQDQFPWPLLQALFFYLMRLLRTDNVHKDTDILVLGIRDLPTAIVVRCAIEYPRLRTVWERRGASNDMGTTRKESNDFMEHLQWIYQFSKQVVECTDDELDVGFEHESGANAVSALRKAEFSFSDGMDVTKFQMLILKYLFRWNMVQVPDLTTQSHLVKPFYVKAARRILRLLDAHKEPMLSELASCFVGEWLEIAFAKAAEEQQSPAPKPRPVDFYFQLLLVHTVAELCKRSAHVPKNLLRSWRNATSSAKTDSSALFIALLTITMSDGANDTTTSTDQFDQVLEMNSSIWVNELPQITLHVLSVGLVSSEPAKPAIESNSSVVKLIKVIANAQSFKECLTLAVYKVLRHGVVNQVDVLDASLPHRIRQVWPTLSDIVSQLPVLSLDDDLQKA